MTVSSASRSRQASPVPLAALALGILAGLGKDLDREKQITQRDAWRLARVWLNAEEIHALIVIGADQLDVATWRQLSDVCRQIADAERDPHPAPDGHGPHPARAAGPRADVHKRPAGHLSRLGSAL